MAGNDDFDGGAGTDTAGFKDVSTDFTFSTVNGVTQVKHRDNLESTWDGNDKYTSVERLEFADKTVFLVPNKAPNAAPNTAVSVTEDATPNTVTGDVLLATEDSEGDAVKVDADFVGVRELQHGTLSLSADGTFTYTLDNGNAAVNALNNGGTLKESFAFKVSDYLSSGVEIGTAASASTLDITISGSTDVTLASAVLRPSKIGLLVDSSYHLIATTQDPPNQPQTSITNYADAERLPPGVIDGIPNQINTFTINSYNVLSASNGFSEGTGITTDYRDGVVSRIRHDTNIGRHHEQGMIEFDVSNLPATLQKADLTFTSMNGHQDSLNKLASFELHMYAGDNLITSADWNVNSGPAISASTIRNENGQHVLSLDHAAINQMIAAGVDYIGVHMKALNDTNTVQHIDDVRPGSSYTYEGHYDMNYSGVQLTAPTLSLDYVL